MTKIQEDAQNEIFKLYKEQLLPLFILSDCPFIMAGDQIKNHPRDNKPCYVDFSITFDQDTLNRQK